MYKYLYMYMCVYGGDQRKAWNKLIQKQNQFINKEVKKKEVVWMPHEVLN